jgi:hypothetical protein
MAGPDHHESSSNMPTGGGTALAPEASTAAAVARYVEGPGSSRVTSDAPDWSLVHFDVGCARCGHDLRGRSEPVCPACSLEFDWSQAVPLEELICAHCGYHLYGLSENRCPECGESFTWEAALADYHLRCKPWFEYQWTKTPIRSFARAVSFAVRPRRLWSEMSIHDPPRLNGLLVLWLMSAAFLVGVPVIQTVLFSWIIGVLWARQRWITFFDSANPAFGMRYVLFGLVMLGVLTLVILLTLLSMRWSLAKCKVRSPHVLRVCVYLAPLLCLMPGVLFVFLFLYDLNNMYDLLPYHFASSLLSLIILTLMFVWAGWATSSLALAYRQYIKMPHAWGVAVAAIVAGVLSVLIGSTWAALFGIFA